MKPLLLLSLLAATSCSAPSSITSAPPRPATHQPAASCSLSFRDLFHAAKGRDWTDQEVQAFQKLDQPAKNAMVKQLAAEAGNIRTQDQLGTDGITYTAFWKE